MAAIEVSDLRVAVELYSEDKAAILRRCEVEYSPVRRERLRKFYGSWSRRLAEADFEALNREGRIDHILLGNRIRFETAMLDIEEKNWSDMAPLLPFADRLRELQEARHDRKRVDAREAAGLLDRTAAETERISAALAEDARKAGGPVKRPGITPAAALRAARHTAHLKEVLEDWNRFYHEYDPVFTWWVEVPFGRIVRALDGYIEALRLHLVGIRPGEPEPIVGDPIGAEAMRIHLAHEMIPYTVEELIAIGWKEFRWIEEQFRIVSRDMGFGDDWKAALEHCKSLAPPPGEKAWVIFDIAEFSEDFVERLGVITVPPLAAEVWRLAMMTRERQRTNPFFGGGEVTRASYPTRDMDHEEKLMSMRGNTPYFNFATVHHELIPGHHLQGFMTRRYNPHRSAFSTPFWGEEWALYWEFLLWDAGFPRVNEEKIGMLFWRLHRAARALVSEEAETFFFYSPARTAGRRGDGKKFRHDIADGREVVWMSERDGWNHLYLYDGVKGTVKNQITKGPWVVRGVEKVDEAKRQIWFLASGIRAGQDPYFIHACRVNFDGTGMTVLTEAAANHSVQFSPDMAFYLDIWSRVDCPPMTELRRTADNAVLMTVEKADITALVAAGWKAPEVFTAKGRDGKTDIWGIIHRPRNYDPEKKYPVIEYIYAGPHSSFVPKSFQAYNAMPSLAELGFIVSQVDGMGTSNRSKAFHDVCWKNIGDAGFPARVLWHKAVAAGDPSYDITRVGIYGNSAGGQNALGGMLFHPDFYTAAVSSCGCHDNRMDKMWWNEQWMGWPIGPEYSASSNRDNARRLKGHLLLIVGELDTNVDPASTMQVVDALIKSEKVFDLLVIPGGGHGMGGSYGTRKMMDFFVRHLHGEEPPAWNALDVSLPRTMPRPGR